MTKISAKRREESAVVRPKEGKKKFPVDSAQTASSALKMLGHAKPPLTPAQRSAVISKAAKFVPEQAAAKRERDRSQKEGKG